MAKMTKKQHEAWLKRFREARKDKKSEWCDGWIAGWNARCGAEPVEKEKEGSKE